jgi:hypothetical protein
MYNRVRNAPGALVTIYRALPAGIGVINSGDWVTPSKEYARGHGAGETGWEVIAAQVPAGELWQNGDSYFEMGYSGDDIPGAPV